MIRTPLATGAMTIGLLGGSFNPPHLGHVHISLVALKRLRLDRLWWLVSPGNPLKSHAGLRPLKERLSRSHALARHPRIDITAFEAGLPTPYSSEALAALRRRYPRTQFVWVIGADILVNFHLWRNWEQIFSTVPIAVIDRPGYRFRAMASKAAQKYSHFRIEETDASGIGMLKPPVWTIITAPHSPLSSTEIRENWRNPLMQSDHSGNWNN